MERKIGTKSICFVGLDNYPVLVPEYNNNNFGGESVQQTILSKEFADQGFEVSMVVSDLGQPDGEVVNKIKVWKTYKKNAGIPILKFFHPRLSSILKALHNADADIYYQSCAGILTGVVAWFCKRHHRKFIFRTASDSDCIPDQLLIRYWRDKKIYEYGLKNADIITVQGIHQRDLLFKNYGLKSVPINMAVEYPASSVYIDAKEIDVLWVNNIRSLKRPELLMQLAKTMPHRNIFMIGGPCGDFSYYQTILNESKKIKNLCFLGPIPYHDVNSYFSKAKVFVNTSEIEGFPNSFLQSWARGVPVVSFFDPNSLIKQKKLGFVPTSIEKMAEEVDELLKDDNKRAALGENTRQFVLQNYLPVNVVKEYLKCLA